MQRAMSIGVAAAGLGAMVASASAIDDVITFDELPVGTAIDGRTVYGYATFLTQTQAFVPPTVEVEGTPEPSEYGEGAFLVGEAGDVVTIELATPATRVSVDWTLNDTAHSSVQAHLTAFDSDGLIVGFVQGFPETTGTWPSIMGDNCAGTVVVDGVGEIAQVHVSFAGAVFADTFALDNIEIATVACARADVAEPYGSLDFSDVVRFLSAFGAGESVADIALPFGTLDFTDVVEFVTSFGGGCG